MRLHFIITVFLFLTSTSIIKSQDYAIALKINTLGLSTEVVRSFGENISARIGVALFSDNLQGGGSEKDEYSYDVKIGFLSFSALADYFPFKSGFKLTTGFVINLNKIQADLKPTKSYTVGGDVYTPDLLGRLNANINFNKFAPYFGIGFGNPTAGTRGIGFTFDIGTFYQGAPKAKLSATGLIEPSASPEQQQKLENNLNWFKWYPVISFGLTYKF